MVARAVLGAIIAVGCGGDPSTVDELEAETAFFDGGDIPAMCQELGGALINASR